MSNFLLFFFSSQGHQYIFSYLFSLTASTIQLSFASELYEAVEVEMERPESTGNLG